VQFGLPQFLKKPLRHYLTSRPYFLEKCRVCGICRDSCPSGAILQEDKGLAFDYDRCIRCFCCRELCPYNALGIKEGRLLRIIKKYA
jgi:ferredoxin